MTLPRPIHARLCQEGLITPDQAPTALLGGRSNQLWHTGSLVIKLYNPARQNPLFGNAPDLEWAALGHLWPLGMAPRVVCQIHHEGQDLIVYAYQNPVAPPAPQEIGAFLARLHSLPPPRGFPTRGSDWLAQTAQRLGVAISPDQPACGSKVFLHGDPVVGNFVHTAKGLVAIDWQCPAIGDPCDDLAIALSPGMQSIYADRPWTADEIAAFWAGYDNLERARHYQARAADYATVLAGYFTSRQNGPDQHAAGLERARL